MTISADLGGTALGQALDDAMALPAIKNKPSSVELQEVGDAEIIGKLFSGFGMATFAGVMCVFYLLVFLFKDFVQPVTVLSALPLSLGGSIIALLMAGAQLSLPALIGSIMLMGIVTKNSILLGECTIVGMKESGHTVFDAIIDACHKRARPIVMTTVAMIAGMTPIALGSGRRRQLSATYGDCGHRRAYNIHVPQPLGGAGHLHLCQHGRSVNRVIS